MKKHLKEMKSNLMPISKLGSSLLKFKTNIKANLYPKQKMKRMEKGKGITDQKGTG